MIHKVFKNQRIYSLKLKKQYYSKQGILVQDSKDYLNKKNFFEKTITLYGRNVVAEALQDKSIEIHKLHMADSNKQDKTISKILDLAKSLDVEVSYHSKSALSRISKNAKQDQGVALDIFTNSYQHTDEIKKLNEFKLIALDGIQNPQNLGMIIRSCAAGNVDGIILPKKNSAKISPLVIKASAGTLFKLPIFYCNTLEEVLAKLEDVKIYSLSSHAKNTLYTLKKSKKTIFILGNESDGVSEDVAKLCNDSLSIPMQRGVESLNVAVTASLIAFYQI